MGSSKLICLSDPHLLETQPVARLDDAPETQFNKFKFVVEWARDNNAVLLIPGDFSDRPRAWGVLSKYSKLLYETEVEVLAVFGQHDTYMYSEKTRGKTVLGVLRSSGVLGILNEDPVTAYNPFWIYGASWGQEIPEVLHNSGKGIVNVLVIHAPVSDAPLFPGHDFFPHKAFLKRCSEYDAVFVGDIHRKFSHKTKKQVICNSGPLLRRTVKEWDHEPGFWVYGEERRLSWVEIPHESADEVLTREHIEKVEAEQKILGEFVDAMSAEIDYGINFERNVSEFLKANKVAKSVQEVLAEIMEAGQ